jgi:hypothetical protein
MNNNDILTQLAGRMGTSAEEASAWLEAVLDVLHGAYAGGGAGEMVASRAMGTEERGQSLAPRTPVLRSVTPTARLSIGEEIALDRFPFRVGREGRSQPPAPKRSSTDRRLFPRGTTNELYVKDFGKSVNVSREHFQIEAKADGTFELVDRGSACGTIVGDQVIGGNFIGGRCPLEIGDCIVVGTRQSAIVFEFGLR